MSDRYSRSAEPADRGHDATTLLRRGLGLYSIGLMAVGSCVALGLVSRPGATGLSAGRPARHADAISDVTSSTTPAAPPSTAPAPPPAPSTTAAPLTTTTPPRPRPVVRVPRLPAASAVASAPASGLGARAVQIASEQNGKPYQSGASGPNSFDCSGLTEYVFGQLGYRLPHSATDQYQDVKHVPNAAIQPGDLVFVPSGGGMQHVAIYAGNGRWWSADTSGTTVREEAIWASNYVVGRVG